MLGGDFRLGGLFVLLIVAQDEKRVTIALFAEFRFVVGNLCHLQQSAVVVELHRERSRTAQHGVIAEESDESRVIVTKDGLDLAGNLLDVLALDTSRFPFQISGKLVLGDASTPVVLEAAVLDGSAVEEGAGVGLPETRAED
jgi:hypothetical protein